MEIEQWWIEPSLGQERNKEIKDFPEFNENEGTMYPNLWDAMRVVLRGKFIAFNAYKKKSGEIFNSDLTTYLKV